MKNVSQIASCCIVATLLAISIAVGFNNAPALQRGPPEGVEVLTRGPVHKAFAEGVTLDPERNAGGKPISQHLSGDRVE